MIDVWNILQPIAATLPSQAAAMPVSSSLPLDPSQVTPFGLDGDAGARTFYTGVSIAAAPGSGLPFVPVQAMFDGQITLLSPFVSVGAARADGGSFFTRRAGLLLAVDPRSELKRALQDHPAYPLDLPPPAFVVYEGIEVDPGLLAGAPIVRDETLPFFAFDSDALPPGHASLLDGLAADLDANPNWRVALVGHTDDVGDSAYNHDLGMRRAVAVQTYLAGAGIDAARIAVDSQGETSPLWPNPSPAEAGINRRVEIRLVADSVRRVSVGEELGRASEHVTVTVLTAQGLYLDPLALALAAEPQLKQHPLAAMRDTRAPRICSHRVRCVTSASADGAAVDDRASFGFYGDLEAAIAAGEEHDTVWVCRDQVSANAQLARSLHLVGRTTSAGGPPSVTPQNPAQPILSAELGVDGTLSLIGLRFSGGRAPAGGAAAHIARTGNVHVAGCVFEDNYAGPDDATDHLAGNGGSLKLEGCRATLVERCTFRANRAHYGGALFAENCARVVVAGSENAQLESALQDESEWPAPPPPDMVPVQQPNLPPALSGSGFDSIFDHNESVKAGGALSFIDSFFYVMNGCFIANRARAKPGNTFTEINSYGGAVAARLSDEKFGGHVLRSLFRANWATCGGAVGVMGSNDGNAAVIGVPNTVFGGGTVSVGECIVHDNNASAIGGGLHLLGSGSFEVRDNRISMCSALKNGGGGAIMGNAQADVLSNLIQRNAVTRVLPDEAPGGGGGLYFSIYCDPINLGNNRFVRNRSTEDGGALRATCGCEITLLPGNVFIENRCNHNGGAISIRNSDLTVSENNSFTGNRTEAGNGRNGGDGGAIHVGAQDASSGAVGAAVFAPCLVNGASLAIAGSAAQPVLFEDNEGVGQGGGVFLWAQRSQLAAHLYASRIEHARFEGNQSNGTISATAGGSMTDYTGSTLAVKHLNDVLFALPPGELTLANVQIALSQGVGLYLIDSDERVIQTNVTFHTSGAGATPVIDQLAQDA